MKILKFLFVFLVLFGCNSKKEKDWNIDVSGIGVNVSVTDISKDFYNLDMPISEFRKKYSFYLDKETSDQKYEEQRRDTIERNVYLKIEKTLPQEKIKNQLADLFRHIKYYYPEFNPPKVFLYSSMFHDDEKVNPITYVPEQNLLFIAADYFLGENDIHYKEFRIDPYLRKSMTPEYLVPKVSMEFAKVFLPKKTETQSFVSYMVYEGKLLIMQDAFLPQVADQYKIGYTKEQIAWAKDNEFQIWNYFVENQYVFSQDQQLGSRFLALAPFSKFYNNVDQKSPGQIGCWIGWQICRKYFEENPKTTLQDFVKMENGEEIFAKSKYKPKELEVEPQSK